VLNAAAIETGLVGPRQGSAGRLPFNDDAVMAESLIFRHQGVSAKVRRRISQPCSRAAIRGQ
jgi:hypothetical protein